MKKARAAAIFTDDEIREIRVADARGLISRRDLAKVWEVSKETIARIARKDTYNWVPDDPTEAELAAEPTEEEKASAQRMFTLYKSLHPDEIVKDLQDGTPTDGGKEDGGSK